MIENLINGPSYYKGSCQVRNDRSDKLIFQVGDETQEIFIKHSEFLELAGKKIERNHLDPLYECNSEIKLTYLKNFGVRLKLEKITN